MTVGGATSARSMNFLCRTERGACTRPVQPVPWDFAAVACEPTMALTCELDRVDVPSVGEAGWGAGGAVRRWTRATCSAGTAARPSSAAVPTCGEPLTPGKRFCRRCGATLFEAAPARPRPSPAQPVREVGRRTADVLGAVLRRRRVHPAVRGPGPGGGPRAAVAVLHGRADGDRPVRRGGREVHRGRGDGRMGHPGGDRRRRGASRPGRAGPGGRGRRTGRRVGAARPGRARRGGDRRGGGEPGRGR